MIEDYFKLALRNLKIRKTRSFLTFLGITLAIMTIFVLISLSFGLNQAVQEQFEILGTDKFFIQPKGSFVGPGADQPVQLTMDDVEVVKKVKGVKSVAYSTAATAKIEFKDEARYYFVLGIPLEDPDVLDAFFEASDIEVEHGRQLKKGDLGKITIGYNYKYKNLFKKPVNVGDTLKLNNQKFKVVGIVEQIGNPGDDQQIYMGWEDDFKQLFNTGERVDYLMIEINNGEDIKEVAERVERKLMKARNLDEDTIDFSVLTPEELLSSFGNILNILTAFLVGIGSISVLVGGIGIANTMYTSVLERKKEIGTMKAVGAKNSDIMKVFLIESGVLGIIGGIFGLIIGLSIAKIIEYIVSVQLGSNILRASTSPGIFIGCLVFAFLVGVFSGFLPSRQASKLVPVEALRYE